jgi:hypothetical protein
MMSTIKQSTHGFNSLAYLGSPFTPAAVYIQEVDPLPNNNQGIPLGTIWINTAKPTIFMLVEKLYVGAVKKTQATWISIIGISLVNADVGSAVPVGGVINVLGDSNINTTGAGNTITIHLDDSIGVSGNIRAGGNITAIDGNLILPNTTDDEVAGEIQFGGFRFISNYGTGNTFVGTNSGNTTYTGLGANAGFGNSVLTSLTLGVGNSSLGAGALTNATTGSFNSSVGSSSLLHLTSGSSNCAFGLSSGSQLVSGSNNILIGNDSGSAYIGGQSSNICIGSEGLVTDTGVIRIGTDGILGGQQAICFIAGNLYPTRSLYLSAPDNAGIDGWIYSNTPLSATRVLGMPGAQNLFLGQSAGNNTAGGFVNAQSNVGIGPSSLGAITTGVGNSALGANSGAFIKNAAGNVLIGENAGNSIVANLNNVCVGYYSGNNLTSGDLNVLVGAYSGQLINGNTGSIGNTALGYGALTALVGGSANLALGGLAGQNLTGAESNNVLIQSNGVTGHSREIRIGSQYTGGAGDGQQSACWIAGIRGVTTTNADAIPVLIDSLGQLGTVSSSERYKDDIEDMGPESDMIMALRPVTFTYKQDASKRQQFGLIAEEVAELFPKLVVYDQDGLPDTIRYHELPVLLLNELQKYAVVIENLKERIEVLERSIK